MVKVRVIRGGSRILCQGGRKSAKGLGTTKGLQRVQGRALGRGPQGAKLPGSSWVFSIQEAFPSTILKHFVNVMKCIKTHESFPKSFKQFLSSECKLKGRCHLTLSIWSSDSPDSLITPRSVVSKNSKLTNENGQNNQFAPSFRITGVLYQPIFSCFSVENGVICIEVFVSTSNGWILIKINVEGILIALCFLINRRLLQKFKSKQIN